jgi:hypothetical protein
MKNWLWLNELARFRALDSRQVLGEGRCQVLRFFVVLNLKLDGASLVAQIRSPFEKLIEGLFVSSNRGDRI